MRALNELRGLRFPDDYLIKMFFKDRKSTRLNSSHLVISYAVFCLKKKMSHFSFVVYSLFRKILIVPSTSISKFIMYNRNKATVQPWHFRNSTAQLNTISNIRSAFA